MSSTDFEFFIFLCQAGSISKAARELDITPAAASKRLANIEKNIGCQLVTRSTRAMSLTPNGNIYLEYAKKVTSTIEEMNYILKQESDEAEGLIRINAPFGFGRKYVSRFVADFIEEYPKVECQLHLSDQPLNLIANSFDVGIRFGSLPDSGLHAKKIASHQRFVCASPLYLNRHIEPKHPRELSDHNCIILRQNEDTYGNWSFSKHDEVHHVRVRGTLSSNDGESVLSWTLRGHGIAIRAEWDIYHHLKEGQLIRLLSEYQLPNADIYAVYPYSQNLPARIRLFIDHLAKKMKIVPFQK
ncbi:LysR family transcriptional regulator [Billgrantia diversa]|uniref:LysR family transcriptional regulator n=1 Tax=Halomonas sp. MCCC 1A13316 TaxID=2733487 RepID=UPI0018A559D9|nr:LysR family transcriptional regulator [Halomonas sp. MCCC 1A13316]QOR37153.1 LysR family transcriptional regulator [Halomonas sp. MCCC 1A13316]